MYFKTKNVLFAVEGTKMSCSSEADSSLHKKLHLDLTNQTIGVRSTYLQYSLYPLLLLTS